MNIVEPSVDLEGLEVPVVVSRNKDGGIVVRVPDVDAYGTLITEASEKLLEKAGRTCYKSENFVTPDSFKSFTKKILTRNHMSVTEHSSATFRIVCDRGVSHELVRHRLAAFSQESTRYCNYGTGRFGGEITVIRPQLPVGPHLEAGGYPNSCPGFAPSNCPECTKAQNALDIWTRATQDSEARYFEMLKSGCSPQQARSVLTNSLKTEIVMTCNFREWRHVMMLRMAKEAHPDMVRVANMLYEYLKVLAPELFARPLSREEMLLETLMKLSFSNDPANDYCLCCYGMAAEGHSQECIIGQALGEKVCKAA